jgi:hypothetical protein
MSYAVDLAPQVIAELQRLPAAVAEYMLDQIDVLARDPVRLSQPGAGAYPFLQVFEFGRSSPGDPHHFQLLFIYSQDEQTIHVVEVTAYGTS